MADSGGLPQVTQVRLLAFPPLSSLGSGNLPHPPNPRQPIKICACPSFLQPGKLTEAFKYFLQGMGYSKYTHPRDWWQAATLG